MRFAVRLAMLCAGLAFTGCAQMPYANDPLLRGPRAVWLAREPAPRPPEQLKVEPPPPPTSRWE